VVCIKRQERHLVLGRKADDFVGVLQIFTLSNEPPHGGHCVTSAAAGMRKIVQLIPEYRLTV
jgi:hypothetical protein